MNHRTVSCALLVALSLGALIYVSRYRPTPPKRPRDVDAMYLYAAGLTWRDGANPYDYPTFERQRAVVGDEFIACNFAYAPTVSAPAVVVSYQDPEAWKATFAWINLGAVVVSGLCLGLLNKRERPASDVALIWPILLVTASPMSSANVHYGQTSVVALAFGLLAFVALQGGRDWLAGTLLGIATFKISIVAGVVAWCALQGRVRVVAALAGAALLLASPAIFQAGLLGTALEWLGSLREYRQFPQNHPAFPSSFGANSLLAKFGWPDQWTWVVSVGFLVWTWLRRTAMTQFEQFSVVLSLPILFVSAHDYDAVALAPLALTAMLAADRNWSAWSLAILLAACYLTPPSLFQYWGLSETLRTANGLAIFFLVVGLVEMRGTLPLTDPVGVRED